MLKVSIVIPIYNEEKILKTTITTLVVVLEKISTTHFEIVLVQNGSTDNTKKIALDLADRISILKIHNLRTANFGDAFKFGVRKARYPYIILFNADWWEIDFLKRSLLLLLHNHIVVGSKSLNKKRDKRPVIRKFGSYVLTFALCYLFGYYGSDSHGLKAFRKKELLEILDQCVTHEIIESEILIRANAMGLRIKEIPVSIKEIRPARLSFLYRCFRVSKELLYLYKNYKKGI